TVSLNLQTSGPEALDLFYGCGSSLNWDGFCSPKVDELLVQQSMEADEGKRKQLLWAIERQLAEDVARPIIFSYRPVTCWKPSVDVDPRRSGARGVAAGDGGLQQPRPLQAGCRADQPAIDRAGPGDELGVERGRSGVDLAAAPGRQMARRETLHRGRRQVHLG